MEHKHDKKTCVYGESAACCHGYTAAHSSTLETGRPKQYTQAGRASDSCSIFRITKMDCPVEEQLIRKKLETVRGINELKFNLLQRVLTVEHSPGVKPAIIAALNAIDMAPQDLAEQPDAPLQSKIPWKSLAMAGLLALLSETCELADKWSTSPAEAKFFGISLMEACSLLLALAAIYLGGLGTFKKGWIALSIFKLNINALMTVAVTGAVLIGQFPEAAMVMVLFNISESIEAMSLDRARNAIRSLLDLAPKMMTIKNDRGNWIEEPIGNVAAGSIARVRPGEKIGLDGLVVSGSSEVNQASITGESMPVEKKAGDFVYGGTLNESGSFEYKVTAGARDTTLARIIQSVEEAQASRAPMQKFVDMFAQYYTPCVFMLAILWAVFSPLILGYGLWQSIYMALVLLVIGCPCALVISTPVTVVSGLAAATRKGLLVKGGLFLEQGRRMNWLALDKTGTITQGKPSQTDFEVLGDLSEKKAESIALSLAERSDHPVSLAIACAARNKGIVSQEISDFTAIAGRGICGRIQNQQWSLGNYKLVESSGFASRDVEKRIARLESAGKTVVVLTGPSGVAALIAVADTVRKTSVQAISELKKLNVKTVMLTGDNRITARAIAKEVGVDDYRANLLPEDKQAVIAELEREKNFVGMAGDGINDAPALAMANIGFAMANGGTDTALETADVALMDDDLRKIPAFIRLSSATHAILCENIAFAIGIKAIFFALTLSGNATMWMAVFADVGAALLVVANGMRALRK